jgi:DNA-binding transcriptional LysR family regulator
MEPADILPRAHGRRFWGIGIVTIRKSPRTDAPAKPVRVEPNWSDLSTFLAVAETGSLTKAADRLRTTQPTVSKRLDELEAELGVTLTTRSPNGVVLTEEGRVVARHAASMSRSVHQLTRAVSMRDRAAAGLVSIVCPDALATYLLAPNLAAFQRAFPGITLDIRARPDPHTPPDLTIQFRETKRMDDVAISLGWQHYLGFASKDYLDLYKHPLSITDGFNHKLLIHHDHSEQTENWEDKARSLHDVFDPVVTTDIGVFMVRAVCAGAGAAALPSYLAHFEPDLVPLDTGEYARAQFWLVFDREKGDYGRVRQVIEWIKELFDPRMNPWFLEELVDTSEFAKSLSEER